MAIRALLLLLFLSLLLHLLSFFIIAGLLVFRANLLHRVLVAIVLLSLVVFLIILVNLLHFLFVLFAIEGNVLLIVLLLIFVGWLLVLFFALLSFLLVSLFAFFIPIVILAFLHHALQMLKDHLPSEKASDESLHLYDGYQSALVDLYKVFFILVTTLAIIDARR